MTIPPADSNPEPPASGDRRDAVGRAVREWCGQLIDLGGRNTLLYFRDLQVGSLDLSGADATELDRLLDGRSVALSRLIPDPTELAAAARRCRAVRAKSKENYEERGLRTLSLGLGIATWTNSRGTSTPAAPVVLRSLTLSPRSAGEDDFDVALTDDWELNPTLLHMLRTEHKVALDGDELVAAGLDADGQLATAPLFEQLRTAAAEVPGWGITDRTIVANLSYVKMPMVADLEGSLEALLAHPLICALAGSTEDRSALRTAQVGLGDEIDEAFADRQEPRDEFLVLDADASQSRVVNLAVRGANLVVQGPPGTGKSQTIANLIATLVARGRSVLFVAEKRAAIDAVLNRLRQRGLEDLVLDMHEGTGSRKRLAADLGRTLQAMSRVPEPQVDAMQAELRSRRDDLNRHVAAMHEPRAPWGVSVFDLQATMLAIDPTVRSDQLIPAAALDGLDPDTMVTARDFLAEWVALEGPAIRSGVRPWSGAVGRVTTGEQVQQAQHAVAQLRTQAVPTATERLQGLLTAAGFGPPATVEDAARLVDLVAAVGATLLQLRPEIFTADLDALITGLAPARKGAFGRALQSLFNGRYRSAKRDGAALALGDLKPRELLDGAEKARTERDAWAARSVDGAPPRSIANAEAVTTAFQQLWAELEALRAWIGDDSLFQLGLTELTARLDALSADDATLNRLPRVAEILRSLSSMGLDGVVNEVAQRGLSVDAARELLAWVWAGSVLKRVAATDPLIGAFDGTQHDRIAREFVARDEEQLLANVERVKREVAEAAVAARNANPEQSEVLERNARLKRRHASVRDLLQMAPDVLLAVRPCWVMSPLVISQLLPSDRTYFDVVVFDEASQIRPADAIPALARGRQAVVAGDSKQLPPTTFFDVTATPADEDATAESWTQDMDSILDALSALLPANQGSTMLNWHYRSRDERLIAFSNAQPDLYDWSLTTFPGALGDGCLRHIDVPHRPGVGGTTESSTDEVAAVVELVREHARTHPNESLGVIAMGRPHADRIGEALRLARQEDPDLDDLMDEGTDEPFFVKNLERVQGDERDAIILTVGYPKTADGRMQYRFGPLNQEGGERRLNVAITRARNRMTTVSAFGPEDMDDTKLTAAGAQMLKRYLAYARSGGTELGQHATPRPPLNGFETDVKNRLTAAGIPLVAQYGVAGFWIDFAAQHPHRPGEMVLALEADGATYHSSNTARERDRLRQSHLERLGWEFHRIWSTDWFNHTDREVRKAVAAYEAAVAAADERRAQGATARVVSNAPPPVTTPPAVSSGPLRSGNRPTVAQRQPIDDYADPELDALCQWVMSDALLRTDAELFDELMHELGYRRHGKKIVARLNTVVARNRR